MGPYGDPPPFKNGPSCLKVGLQSPNFMKLLLLVAEEIYDWTFELQFNILTNTDTRVEFVHYSLATKNFVFLYTTVLCTPRILCMSLKNIQDLQDLKSRDT